MPLGGKNALEGMREAGPYIGLGFQLFAAILLFTGSGYWLDTQLGTLPGLTLVGAAASFAMILYLVLRIAKDADTRSSQSQSPPPHGPSSPRAGSTKKRDADSSASSRGLDFHSGHKRRMSGKE